MQNTMASTLSITPDNSNYISQKGLVFFFSFISHNGDLKSNTRILRALTFAIRIYLKTTYDFYSHYNIRDYIPFEVTSILSEKVFSTQVQESRTKRIYNSGRTLPSANQ
mgnify:CR=1 FL=1